MLAGVLLFLNPTITAAGFAPNWYEGQNNRGLGVYIAPGNINGLEVNGQVSFVPANSVTRLWINTDGTVGHGSSVPATSYGIATIISGQILTSTLPLGQYMDGILTITDIRVR